MEAAYYHQSSFHFTRNSQSSDFSMVHNISEQKDCSDVFFSVSFVNFAVFSSSHSTIAYIHAFRQFICKKIFIWFESKRIWCVRDGSIWQFCYFKHEKKAVEVWKVFSIIYTFLISLLHGWALMLIAFVKQSILKYVWSNICYHFETISAFILDEKYFLLNFHFWKVFHVWTKNMRVWWIVLFFFIIH